MRALEAKAAKVRAAPRSAAAQRRAALATRLPRAAPTRTCSPPAAAARSSRTTRSAPRHEPRSCTPVRLAAVARAAERLFARLFAHTRERAFSHLFLSSALESERRALAERKADLFALKVQSQALPVEVDAVGACARARRRRCVALRCARSRHPAAPVCAFAPAAGPRRRSRGALAARRVQSRCVRARAPATMRALRRAAPRRSSPLNAVSLAPLPPPEFDRREGEVRFQLQELTRGALARAAASCACVNLHACVLPLVSAFLSSPRRRGFLPPAGARV